jgi:hypothetical protein
MSREFWNKWTKGERHLIRQPLPADMLGITGCRLDRGIIDDNVGSEVFVTILEGSDFSQKLVAIEPLTFFCKTGMGNMDKGLIIFLVFSVFNDSERLAAYEMFLNPFETGAIDLLTDLARQSHIKVLLHDSDCDEIRGFYEFENNLSIDKFVDSVNLITRGRSPGDFELAKSEFMDRYSLEDMLEL